MNQDQRDKDKLKNEDTNKTVNKGNKVPNIHPVQGEDVNNDKMMRGDVGGAPSQKSGSRGSSDVQDGGQDMGSSAGSH
ncbi:hypothetical protein [Pontibacter ruber]|uniref:Uncharacterized protein n=1 Tax=Pontibacter ruber TaxID=1343895 RepID=A0ABW5CV51_9BACT|nr:hypothetical protein [Pontibacter ruber]